MYYPKSKIESNLTSNGEFVIESTGIVYYGPYFKTSTGLLYTGEEPNSGDNLSLTPIPEESKDYPGIIDYRFLSKTSTYSRLTNQPLEYTPNLPITYYPILSEADYQTGEFTRYFAKKRNENIYYEVENEIVSSNPLYFTFSIQWVISGKKDIVESINRNTVSLYMERLPLPAFNKFLKNDYLKFWKPS